MKLTPSTAKARYKVQVAGVDPQQRAQASAKRIVERGAAAKQRWMDDANALPDGAFKRSLAEH